MRICGLAVWPDTRDLTPAVRNAAVANLISADDPSCVDEAVHLLHEGQIVSYPTDTAYGLGVAAGNDAAVRRLYAVKGRQLDKPLPLLIADPAAASWLAEVTPAARALITRFWPGALTIVMNKLPEFRSLALAKQDKIALRVPDHNLAREIIHRLGQPITGTSANRAGGRTPVSAAEVAFQMGDMVALVIDGGPCRRGVESTVIDITVTPPAILREGAVSREDIRQALGGKEVA